MLRRLVGEGLFEKGYAALLGNAWLLPLKLESLASESTSLP